MRTTIYCQCSNCKNRKHHTIIAGDNSIMPLYRCIEVCENSKEISVFDVPSNTLRRTCANYIPKEDLK